MTGKTRKAANISTILQMLILLVIACFVIFTAYHS